MASYTIAFLFLGALTMLVGGIMQLIAAFRVSILWGVTSLVVPLASVVFVIVHWAEAKAGFLTGMAGAVLLVGGVVTCEPIRASYASALSGKSLPSFMLPESASASAPAKDVNTQIQEKRDRIEQLEGQFGKAGVELVAQFQTLSTQRASLHTEDPVAMAKYNAAAATYQTLNTAQKERQQELTTLHQSLDNLLTERSKQQAATARANPAPPVTIQKQAAPQPARTNNKKVVMYTTSSCPACRSAKQYFARKGVSYEERDVNSSSSAREEFQRLGGSGVPLILVGDDVVRGYSEQRLNQLL